MRRSGVALVAAPPGALAAVLLAVGPEHAGHVLLTVGLAVASPVLAWLGLRSAATVSADGVLTVRSLVRTDPPVRLHDVRAVDRRFGLEHRRRLGGLLLVAGAR